ncbi:helix-turn-helix domain-containing protein [Gorillibacterium timonense]|uniref:helix-turn-helix domain-containing protein n=1 Tax=Gorillibacterium timonense TaxID=1689269 RepID=UPI0009EA618E|nr:helix-turn-helix domain-containing protein [Gorillibacterium timonense]
MDYKAHMARVIAYIEENLSQELTLADCARMAGYSDYHFIRVFKYATKLTPADYIRKRRLTEIIKRLDNEAVISDLAFAYGFNSKENFTRAFAAEHRIRPTEFKAAQSSLKLYEPLQFESVPFSVTPEIRTLDPFTVVAYESDEEDPPSFWNKYNCRKGSKKLSGGMPCTDYGVCIWNHSIGKLDYFIGIRKEHARGDLSDTQEIAISGGRYAVFTTPPSTFYTFVSTIHQTWAFINNKWLPTSGCRSTGGHEFETYTEEARTFREQIHIPLEGLK